MRNTSRIAAGLGFWVATGVSGAALAQCADKLEPNKNQYWLLNPVPDDQMRNFSTDRPTKSNVPCTVDAGHFQYETDIVNFTHQVTGSVHTDTLLVPNPTFKVGLTNNIDLELNIAPIVGVHTFNSAPLMSSATWGNGDLFVRSKVNLWGDDGGGTSAFALIPYVKAPTAPTGIGNGASALLSRWHLKLKDEVISEPTQVVALIADCAKATGETRCKVVADAIEVIAKQGNRLNIKPAIEVLRKHADTLPFNDRSAVYDDTEVMLRVWDQYLRSGSSQTRALPGFLSSMALGTSQQIKAAGTALLTVHSSKGLEFEVVFIVGMAEGVFPDYRAQNRPSEMAEEKRNAFVAITRSKRLLYFSYPKQREMPWGDIWQNRPSPFLSQIHAYL